MRIPETSITLTATWAMHKIATNATMASFIIWPVCAKDQIMLLKVPLIEKQFLVSLR